MAGYRKWTDENLKYAVKTSETRAEVLRKLGYKSHNSGNYQTIDRYIKSLNLDISHFSEQKHSCIERLNNKRNISDILVINSSYSSTSDLKKRLLKENLVENKCYRCGINNWCGEQLSLHLDHKNGDRYDNRIENLHLLCPNCHSLTESYCRGKNRKVHKCKSCKNKISPKAQYCKTCIVPLIKKHPKIVWPPINDIIDMVNLFGFSKTGRTLGVSDNSVRKHLKNHGGSAPNRTEFSRASNERNHQTCSRAK